MAVYRNNGPRFQRSVLAAATQSVTISGLDGNAKRMYHFYLRVLNKTSDDWIIMRPNGLTTNLRSVANLDFNASPTGAPTTTLQLGTFRSTDWAFIHGTIWAQANSGKRFYTCQGHDATFWMNCSGAWDESSTNLTSLVFVSSGTSQFDIGSEFIVSETPL